MKKTLLLIAMTGLLCSCGGSSSDKKDDKDSVTTKVKEMQKNSQDIKAKSENYNKQADSLLNNI